MRASRRINNLTRYAIVSYQMEAAYAYTMAQDALKLGFAEGWRSWMTRMAECHRLGAHLMYVMQENRHACVRRT